MLTGLLLIGVIMRFVAVMHAVAEIGRLRADIAAQHSWLIEQMGAFPKREQVGVKDLVLYHRGQWHPDNAEYKRALENRIQQLIEDDELRRKRKQARKAQRASLQTGNHGVTDAKSGSGAS